MTKVFVDFESRSELALPDVGLDRYLKHKSTRPTLLGWAVDDSPVNLWEAHIHGRFPSELQDALTDPKVVKVAFNAPFEHGLFKSGIRMDIPYEQWLDVLVWARHLSVTGDLDTVCKIFELRQEEAKLKEGKRLIKKFCEPCYAGGEETLFGISQPEFRDWDSDPEDWALFGEYCKQDVVAERALLKKMEQFPLPEISQNLWCLDRVINNRGLMCDLDLVRGSQEIAEQIKSELRAKLKEVTGVENPNSTDQLLKWLDTQGYTFSGIGKAFVNRAMNGECDLTPAARTALELRRQFAKTSDSKLEKFLNITSEDGRLRNQYAFMGASRTGRWSSLGGVQMQNLPCPTKAVAENLELAVNILKSRDYLSLSMEFENPMDVITGTLRSVVVAAPGKKLLVCDLNAVEFRVLGHITGCEAINNVFKTGLCPYKDFGTTLFNTPYDEITKEQRQNAKPGVLGGGYQLSGGEEKINEDGDKVYTGLMAHARSLGIELSHELSHDSISAFRAKYDTVVKFWKTIETAALSAFRTKKPQNAGPFVIDCIGTQLMRLHLPSGRALHYIRPRIEENRFGNDGITYEGRLQQKRVIGRPEIYGGKWVENGDQSFSCDLLGHGLVLAEKKGLNPIGHSHDEIICEVDKDSKSALDDLRECMIQTPAWAPGLILDAEGFETNRYRKE